MALFTPAADALMTAATDTAGAAQPAGQLITAAVIGIAIIIVLITWVKLHPFLSLTIGALATGAIAGMDIAASVTSFSTGFGTTMGGVGILIALGAIYGKLLADSGGADRIVDTLVSRASARSPPGSWVSSVPSSGCRCSSRSASCCSCR